MTEDQIDIFYGLEIADDKADALRGSAQQIIAADRAKEPGILLYNVYFSEDEKLHIFWDTHANNDAMRFYSERFANGRYVGQILERTQRASVLTAQSPMSLKLGARTTALRLSMQRLLQALLDNRHSVITDPSPHELMLEHADRSPKRASAS